MAFSGTQQKCKACTKTVYPVEQITADGIIYHKSCFRCSHCKRTLKLSDYSSFESVLYCKPHFQQLFKRTGSFKQSFELGTPPMAPKPETHTAPTSATFADTNDVTTSATTATPTTRTTVAAAVAASLAATEASTPATVPKPKRFSRIASMFSGTMEKCAICSKTVYPLEKVTVEGLSYHKVCFKCSHGGCSISPSNYASLEGRLYCKHHFSQLFKEKGSYNHLVKIPSMRQKQELLLQVEEKI